MFIERKTGHAPAVAALARELAQVQGPCIGCPGCQGLCLALIDAITVPDVILSRSRG